MRLAVDATPLTFACGDIVLEGRLHRPAGPRAAAGVVLCHPHPLYGGSMDNNVVLGLAQTLSRCGFAALRFNFRGVGRSGGCYGEGRAEVADVGAALDALAGVPGVDPAHLAVVGYSFGAWVGLRAGARDPRVAALVAVAPPLALFSMDDAIPCSTPVLAAAGTRDSFCPLEVFQRWFAARADPKEKVLVEGADHFLVGREAEVGAAVGRFLAARFSGAI